LEDFSRTASGGAFVMSNVPIGPLPDVYPPNRITDLQATLDGEEISLTWTAPGDDYDVGRGKNKDPSGFDLSERWDEARTDRSARGEHL
jgi:hypothetical protein